MVTPGPSVQKLFADISVMVASYAGRPEYGNPQLVKPYHLTNGTWTTGFDFDDALQSTHQYTITINETDRAISHDHAPVSDLEAALREKFASIPGQRTEQIIAEPDSILAHIKKLHPGQLNECYSPAERHLLAFCLLWEQLGPIMTGYEYASREPVREEQVSLH